MPYKETAVTLASPTAFGMNILYIPVMLYINSNALQIMILMIFVSIDFISGLMKSHRLCKKFTKYKFFMGIYMKFFTLLLPFLFVLCALGVNYDLTDFIPYCLGALIMMEFYSIIGNIYTVRTGKELEDKDILSYLLLRTRKQIDKKIEKMEREINENK